jgi:hypothetical protein
MNVSYAIAFKAFYYDAEVQRNLQRLSYWSRQGSLYVIVDQTWGRVPDFGTGIRVDIDEALFTQQGYPAHPEGRLFWYNADYPLYCLHECAPDHDYYVMVEHDAAVQCDLDRLVAQARDAGADLVAQRIETPVARWGWAGTCAGAFPAGGIDPRMLCLAVFSRRAVLALRAARLAQAAAWHRGALRQWPIAEGFVGSELRRQGMRLRDLGLFGRLARYDVWPPVHPWELAGLADQAVVHPVLTGRRYLRALLRNGVGAAWRAKLGRPSEADLDYRHVWTTRGLPAPRARAAPAGEPSRAAAGEP